MTPLNVMINLKNLVILTCLAVVISACKKDLNSTEVIPEAAAVSESTLPRENARDVLERGDHWTFVTSAPFMDGGSLCFGFTNEYGEILYVWYDFSIGSASNEYQLCFLKRTYNDADTVIIERGSELESKVIALIHDSNVPEPLKRHLPKERMIEILETRDRGGFIYIQDPNIEFEVPEMPKLESWGNGWANEFCEDEPE